MIRRNPCHDPSAGCVDNRPPMYHEKIEYKKGTISGPKSLSDIIDRVLREERAKQFASFEEWWNQDGQFISQGTSKRELAEEAWRQGGRVVK